MSQHLTQPEEVDLVLMNQAEYGVEGEQGSQPGEVIHDCDGAVGVTESANRKADSAATDPGEIS